MKNLTGHLVYEAQFSEKDQRISLEGIRSGIYSVKLTSDDSSEVKLPQINN